MLNALALGALTAFVFLAPWENMLLLEGVGTLARFVGIVAFPLGVLAVLERRRLAIPAVLVWASLFVAVAAASLFWTVSPERSLARVATYAQLLIATWLIGQLTENQRAVRLLLSAFVFGAWLAMAGTFYSFHRGITTFFARFAAPGFDPNDLAYILSLGIPIAWYLRCDAARITRWIHSAYPPAAFVAVLLTASRGGLVAAALGMLYVLMKIQPKFSAIGAAALALLMVRANPSLLPSDSLERLATLGTELTRGDLNFRMTIWGAGLSAFTASPWLGVGAGAFGLAVADILGGQWTGHNAFISILVEQGLVGAVIFVGLLVTVLFSVLRMSASERDLWLCVMAVLSLALMVGDWEWRKQTWILLALAAAHSLVLRPTAGPSRASLGPGRFA